jgi:hypothetical protein
MAFLKYLATNFRQYYKGSKTLHKCTPLNHYSSVPTLFLYLFTPMAALRNAAPQIPLIYYSSKKKKKRKILHFDLPLPKARLRYVYIALGLRYSPG